METNRTQFIREKILHVLKVYPLISPTMLQISMGPNIKAAEWREQLGILEEEGLVSSDEITEPSPTGRYNTHRRIYRTDAAQVVRELLTAAVGEA